MDDCLWHIYELMDRPAKRILARTCHYWYNTIMEEDPVCLYKLPWDKRIRSEDIGWYSRYIRTPDPLMVDYYKKFMKFDNYKRIGCKYVFVFISNNIMIVVSDSSICLKKNEYLFLDNRCEVSSFSYNDKFDVIRDNGFYAFISKDDIIFIDIDKFKIENMTSHFA